MLGVVKGSFIKEGYYTFATAVSDTAGNSADSFVTVNIQPKTLTSSINAPTQIP